MNDQSQIANSVCRILALSSHSVNPSVVHKPDIAPYLAPLYDLLDMCYIFEKVIIMEIKNATKVSWSAVFTRVGSRDAYASKKMLIIKFASEKVLHALFVSL